jgi:hypothetical protein
METGMGYAGIVDPRFILSIWFNLLYSVEEMYRNFKYNPQDGIIFLTIFSFEPDFPVRPFPLLFYILGHRLNQHNPKQLDISTNTGEGKDPFHHWRHYFCPDNPLSPDCYLIDRAYHSS